MSIINCKVSVVRNNLQGYTGIRRIWTLLGIPVFSTVEVFQ